MVAKINPGLLEAAKKYGEILLNDFDNVDKAAARVADGTISKADLEAVVGDQSRPYPLRIAAKEFLAGPMLFNLVDGITAPGTADKGLTRLELQAAIGANLPSWFTGNLEFKGLASIDGSVLPESRSIEVMSMDLSHLTVRYQDKQLDLVRTGITRKTAESRDEAKAFKTNDGDFLIKYTFAGNDSPLKELSLYVVLTTPAQDRLVSASGEIKNFPPRHASLDATTDAQAFVGLVIREDSSQGTVRFNAIDNMPEMPWADGAYPRYDGMSLPMPRATCLG